MFNYDHDSRGTCHPECPSYGYCHDGCGTPTKISVMNSTRDAAIKWMPWIWKPGHNKRVFLQHYGGYYSQIGIDVHKVRPLLKFLRTKYRTRQALADALGININTLRGYLYKKKMNITPINAKKIYRLTMFYKKGTSPWDTISLEEDTRVW